MAKKNPKPDKARSGSEKALKADLQKVRAQLTAAERSAEKWKAKAKDHRSVAVGAKAELGAVRRRLEKAEASAAKWKQRVKTSGSATVAPVPSTTPDASWNVTRLRAEARSRGVAGYSRKTKEQLLVELLG